MQEKFLIINESSSALKFSLYSMPEKKELITINFQKTGINNKQILITNKYFKKIYISNYEKLIKFIIKKLIENKLIKDSNDIARIGYKILQGGNFYSETKELTNEEMYSIKHMDKNVLNMITNEGQFINTVKRNIPNAKHIAIYDNNFYNNSLYIQDNHGSSHKYIAQRMNILSAREDINIISCYIGNEASICSIKNGHSNNISLSLTPLECLAKERSLDLIDGKIIDFISKFKNISQEETELYITYGMKNISHENDIDNLIKLSNEGSEIAKITLERYTGFIIKNILTFYKKLKGEVNGIVLTGYVGENSKEFRKIILNKLSEVFDIYINDENEKIGQYSKYNSGVITRNESQIHVFVIPEKEELILLEEMQKFSKDKVLTKNLTTTQ